MKLIQCENNHYYSDKLVSCPYCTNKKRKKEGEDIYGKGQWWVDTVILPDESKTEQFPCRRTVGWLVCIEGEMLGESFALREGENVIGRERNMDVALVLEPTVSRENHGIIRYDAEKNNCILHASGENKKIYCNNKEVKHRKTLKDRDIISLGDCSLVFVAFCDHSFSWEE